MKRIDINAVATKDVNKSYASNKSREDLLDNNFSTGAKINLSILQYQFKSRGKGCRNKINLSLNDVWIILGVCVIAACLMLEQIKSLNCYAMMLSNNIKLLRHGNTMLVKRHQKEEDHGK